MNLTNIERSGPDEAAWVVTLPEERGGGHAAFRDAEEGGVLPSLLAALAWRSERTGAPSDWGWVEEGLERVDRWGTHGWWASVDLGSHLDADLFEDAEHGGAKEALLAALAWRRRVARPGGAPRAPRAEPARDGRRRNGKGKGKGNGEGRGRGGGGKATPRAPAEGRPAGASGPRKAKRPRRPGKRPPPA